VIGKLDLLHLPIYSSSEVLSFIISFTRNHFLSIQWRTS